MGSKTPSLTRLLWVDVQQLAHTLVHKYDWSKRDVVLYGIPRGGTHAAQLVLASLKELEIPAVITSNPEYATYFIDDLIDSGETKKRWLDKYPNRPFRVLFDKRKMTEPGWIVFPWETYEQEGPATNIIRILEFIGEDPTREGLIDTPARVLRSFSKLYKGYKQDPADILKTSFQEECDQMVVLKDIEFYSTCEHHMLPFFGRGHIAYIPKENKVVGISKLARLLEVFSRRLQIQERICQQVTSTLDKLVGTRGSACVLEAQHFCMTSRGVKKQHSKMVTSSLTGNFRNGAPRQEFLRLIGK